MQMSLTPRATLLDLPAELILHIHLIALNPHFALVAQKVHHVLRDPSPRYAAAYLLSLYSYYGPDDLLVRCLRHPVCNVEVAREIRRVWDMKRSCVPRARENTPNVNEDEGSQSPDPSIDAPPPLSLGCAELPRRLFRPGVINSEPIHPVLRFLFTTYTPSANSHKGYPLCRAVLTANYPLIAFLLDHGADPMIKDCLAVEIAISKRDLKAVVMLIERSTQESEGDQLQCRRAVNLAARSKHLGKRPRLMDRIHVPPRLVEVAMRKGAEEIVRYFVHEKGELPICTI
ncbi:hypothetical protein BCR39DRAFT_529050 [Naematelia encephala]|uniref:Ankyrin repeat-containing domain protein n=1 Tax=Naematelia encephala TaxID=71784 RepID=A0A1Y2B7S4_9TREE|nr:hypothetical protein BCR39DRAFT_529050 [Naematelia encephala]